MQPDYVTPRYAGSVCNGFKPFAVNVPSKQDRPNLRIAHTIDCCQYLGLHIDQFALSLVYLRDVGGNVIEFVRVWRRRAAVTVIARRDVRHAVVCGLSGLVERIDLVL